MTYLRNTHTGEIHRLGEQGESKEECNLDALRAAGHVGEATEDEVLAELQEHPERACGHCLSTLTIAVTEEPA